MQACGVSYKQLFASRKQVNTRKICAPTVRAVQTNDSVNLPPAQNRRATLATMVGVSGSFLLSSPAFAGLFGGNIKEEYQENTANMIKQAKIAVELPRDAENREEVAIATKKEINTWVAKYRRESGVAGRPSYGTLYSALNALAGHYNSFGLETPIPKKRLDRIQKELSDAEKLLARGR